MQRPRVTHAALPSPAHPLLLPLPDLSGPCAQHIIKGLEAVEAVPGRCEIIDEGQDFGVVVDAARWVWGAGLDVKVAGQPWLWTLLGCLAALHAAAPPPFVHTPVGMCHNQAQAGCHLLACPGPA